MNDKQTIVWREAVMIHFMVQTLVQYLHGKREMKIKHQQVFGNVAKLLLYAINTRTRSLYKNKI